MHLNTVVGSSPRHSKQTLKTVLSSGNNGTTSHSSSNGKKTTGSYKQDGEPLVLGSNNMILSRGRPNQIESTARASVNIPTAGQMSYSKTLT